MSCVDLQRTQRFDPLQVVKTYFGFASFRGQQGHIIRNILSGHDVLAILPTGAGKSLCYQVPALCLEGTALVISPLVVLMEQQAQLLRDKGIAAAAFHCGRAPKDLSTDMKLFAKGSLKVAFISPERVIDQYFQGLLDHVKLSLIAIDEAHCISEWGYDFRPEYGQLSQILKRYPRIPKLALTATASPRVRGDILNSLGLTSVLVFSESVDRLNLSLNVYPKQQFRAQLVRFLNQHAHLGTGLIYCQTRKQVNSLHLYLNGCGFETEPYHAGLPQDERQRVADIFIQGKAPLVIATVAFGMGVNRSDVRYVLHADPPRSLSAYVQQIGRAGRDGVRSMTGLFSGLSDIQRICLLLQREPKKSLREQRVGEFCDVVKFAESRLCRWQFLRVYFGEEKGKECGQCDRCCQDVKWIDGALYAQMLLSAIYRCGVGVDTRHIIDVVMGRRTPYVERFSFQFLGVFGQGADLSRASWRYLLRCLIGDRLIEVVGDQYQAFLRVNEKARPLLKGECAYEIPDPFSAPC